MLRQPITCLVMNISRAPVEWEGMEMAQELDTQGITADVTLDFTCQQILVSSDYRYLKRMIERL